MGIQNFRVENSYVGRELGQSKKLKLPLVTPTSTHTLISHVICGPCRLWYTEAGVAGGQEYHS